ncbi:MAG: Flavobacterium phage 11b [Bacteroidota bacterium]
MVMARPSEYNFDLCVEICEIIAKGENIISALDSDNRFPSWPTFRRWKRNNEELRTLYINSQQDKAEALEKEMDDYRSMLLAKKIDASTYNTLVQTLKWKMSKYYAKMYGDKIQQEHSGEVTTNVISLGSGIQPNETTY